MQTKALAAGERTRWATDTENVGRTFVVDGRQGHEERRDALANTGSAARET